MILIGYYTLIPSFAPVLTEEYVKHGDRLLDSEATHHPNAAILWWMRGRARRASRQVAKL